MRGKLEQMGVLTLDLVLINCSVYPNTEENTELTYQHQHIYNPAHSPAFQGYWSQIEPKLASAPIVVINQAEAWARKITDLIRGAAYARGRAVSATLGDGFINDRVEPWQLLKLVEQLCTYGVVIAIAGNPYISDIASCYTNLSVKLHPGDIYYHLGGNQPHIIRGASSSLQAKALPMH